jgi:hypothetical protein
MKFKTWEEKDYEMQDVLDARTLFMLCLASTGANYTATSESGALR